MIFPNLIIEKKVQVDDKTRLDASRSFAQNETITTIEISPDNSVTFYDVTADGFLDWQFDTDGTIQIVVRLTGSATGPITHQKGLIVVTELEDNLFSDDAMLVEHEGDILNYLREGRNSFIDKHRLSQSEILNDLDKSGIWKDDNSRYTADDIVDIQEFAVWSKFMTLRFIYEGLSNSIDDIFHDKSVRYLNLELGAKKRACLRLDSDGDGTNDDREIVDLVSGDLIRG